MTSDEKLDLMLRQLGTMDQRQNRMEQRLEATEHQDAENRDLLDRVAKHMGEIRQLKLLVEGYTRNFSQILAMQTAWLMEIRQHLG